MAKGSGDSVRNKRKGGFTTIVNEVFDTVGLDTYEKLIYMSLLRFANEKTETCFPSYKKIAESASCSEKTAERTIAKLVEKGFIDKQVRFYENGRPRSNLYTILDLPEAVLKVKPKSMSKVSISNGSKDLNTDSQSPLELTRILGNTDSQSPSIQTHSRHNPDLQSPLIQTESRHDGDSQSVEQYLAEPNLVEQYENNNTYYNRGDTSGVGTDNVIPLFADTTKVTVATTYSQMDVLQIFQSEIGIMSPIAYEMIIDSIKTFGTDWVHAAIVEAVKQGVRKLSYIEVILRNWKTNGFHSNGEGSKKNGRNGANSRRISSCNAGQASAAVDWSKESNSLR